MLKNILKVIIVNYRNLSIILILVILTMTLVGCVKKVEPIEPVDPNKVNYVEPPVEKLSEVTKTRWIYGLSDSGAILFKSTAKSYEVRGGGSQYSFSSSYIVWTDYEGNEYDWNGKFIVSTRPLRIDTPVIGFELVNEVD